MFCFFNATRTQTFIDSRPESLSFFLRCKTHVQVFMTQ